MLSGADSALSVPRPRFPRRRDGAGLGTHRRILTRHSGQRASDLRAGRLSRSRSVTTLTPARSTRPLPTRAAVAFHLGGLSSRLTYKRKQPLGTCARRVAGSCRSNRIVKISGRSFDAIASGALIGAASCGMESWSTGKAACFDRDDRRSGASARRDRADPRARAPKLVYAGGNSQVQHSNINRRSDQHEVDKQAEHRVLLTGTTSGGVKPRAAWRSAVLRGAPTPRTDGPRRRRPEKLLNFNVEAECIAQPIGVTTQIDTLQIAPVTVAVLTAYLAVSGSGELMSLAARRAKCKPAHGDDAGDSGRHRSVTKRRYLDDVAGGHDEEDARGAEHPAAVVSGGRMATPIPVGKFTVPDLIASDQRSRRCWSRSRWATRRWRGVPAQLGLYAAPLGLVGYARCSADLVCCVFGGAGSVARGLGERRRARLSRTTRTRP